MRCHSCCGSMKSVPPRGSDRVKTQTDATALRRGDSRLSLQKQPQKTLKMPRPCAVESHVCRYKGRGKGFSMSWPSAVKVTLADEQLYLLSKSIKHVLGLLGSCEHDPPGTRPWHLCPSSVQSPLRLVLVCGMSCNQSRG